MKMRLSRNGYIPVIIDPPEKARYLEALQIFSRSGSALDGDPGCGNLAPFTAYIADLEGRSLARYLRVLENNPRWASEAD